MKRHEAGTAHVLPIILRPVHWQEAPFGKLQALPTDAEPVRSSRWHSQDEALFDVAKGIRKVVEELKTKFCPQPLENEEKSSTHSHANIDDLKALESTIFPSYQQADHQNREEGVKQSTLEHIPNAWKREFVLVRKAFRQSTIYLSRRWTLKLLAGLTLVGGGTLVWWGGIRTQSHSTPQMSVTPQRVQDQNLAAHFIGTQRSAIALPGDPTKLEPDQLPKQEEEVPVVSIDQQQEEQTTFRIAIDSSNLRRDHYWLVIEHIQLVVERITFIPRPLFLWVQNPQMRYDRNIYLARYLGQDRGAHILAKYHSPPYDFVYLAAKETDQITVQVVSSVSVALDFRIAITYRVAHEEQPHTLTLPDLFQVIFSDKSNWFPYQIEDGHFVRLDTP